jgi:hypothetical protein
MNPPTRIPTGNHYDYWTLLTNHGAVLLHVAEHPDDTVVEMADVLGLRERAVASIIADLRRLGYVEIKRLGRHNHYTVREEMPLRRPAHGHLSVGQMLSGLKGMREDSPSLAARAESQKLHSFFGERRSPRFSG